MRLLLAMLAAAVALPVAAQPVPPPVPAETKSCLMQRRIESQRIVDDRTILFREGGRWYRNDLAVSCAGLSPDKSLITRTPSTGLCRGDQVTVFEPVSNFTYGSCALGDFTRIANPGPAKRPH